jgi:RNA polymerase sigma-70 factor (ECF subfamily)
MEARKMPKSGASMTDWDELMAREGPAVWRTVYRLVQNRADADECFQETFLAALEIANRQPVRNWPALLHRLATSRAIDRLRKRLRRMRHEQFVDLSQTVGTDHDPSEQAEAIELAGALRRAVAQLPAKQGEVFWLHEIGDWSYQQIGDQLGITVNAVGVLLHRARQKLQELVNMQIRTSAALDDQRPR